MSGTARQVLGRHPHRRLLRVPLSFAHRRRRQCSTRDRSRRSLQSHDAGSKDMFLTDRRFLGRLSAGSPEWWASLYGLAKQESDATLSPRAARVGGEVKLAISAATGPRPTPGCVFTHTRSHDSWSELCCPAEESSSQDFLVSNDSTRANVLSASTTDDDSISADIAVKAHADLILMMFDLLRHP